MPKFVIHVGPHKTGSTFIQVALNKLHADLLEKGVLFPLHWRASADQPTHSKLYNRLVTKDPSLQREFDEISAGDVRLVVLSCENFSELSEESLRFFRGLLRDNPVQVLFYIRRWSEVLLSSWQERTKHGSTETLPEFLLGPTANPAANPAINFGTCLKGLATSFGIANLRLVCYSNLVDSKADIFRHFLATFVGLPDLASAAAERANTSAGMYATEIIRSLNVVQRIEEGAVEGRLGFTYLARSRELDTTELQAAMALSVDELIFDEDTPALQLLHTQLFVTYSACLVDPRLAQRLFVPKRGRLQFINQDYLLLHGAADALRHLYRTLRPTGDVLARAATIRR